MNSRRLQLAGAALVVLVGFWAGNRLYQTRHHPTASVDPPPSLPQPDLELAAQSDIPPPKIPDQLPAFSLADRAGKVTSIASWKDKSLIINFWATWCAPCRQEIPLLESLAGEWRGRDVEVVGIAVDHRDQVLEFADRLKITYPVLIGEQDALDAAAAFGFESPVFPFTVFTDRRGEVVTLFVGELHKPQADLILSVVLNLNQNRVQLAAARQAISSGLAAIGSLPAG
jgi:thiol-disulfide isomerase/thioredoxin